MSWHYWHKEVRWKMNSHLFHERIIRILRDYNIVVNDYADIGCDGILTSLIASTIEAEKVVGVDPSKRFLDLLVKNVRTHQVEPIALDLDNDPLPLPENSFGLVTCLEIVEHLLNPDNVHKEAFRILKSGGYFLVAAPNLGSWYNRFLLLLGFQPVHTDISGEYWAGLPAKMKQKASHHGHIAVHTYKGLIELLKHHGFKIVAKRGFSFSYGYDSINFINRLFERTPSLADGMLVLSQKP